MKDYTTTEDTNQATNKPEWPPKDGFYTIIPQSWRFASEMKTKSESRPKFNEVAATLLADLMYWYNPKEDGSKRFKGHLWQTSYDNWGCRWGYSRDVVKDAVKFLVAAGLIETTIQDTAVINGKVRSNVMYVRPIIEAVERITFAVDENTIYARKNKRVDKEVSGSTDPYTLIESGEGDRGPQTPTYEGLQTPILSVAIDPDITKSSNTQSSITKNKVKEETNFSENCDATQPSIQKDLDPIAPHPTSSLRIETSNQLETSIDSTESVEEQSKGEVGLKTEWVQLGELVSDRPLETQNLYLPPPAPPVASPRTDSDADSKRCKRLMANAIGRECGINMDVNNSADEKRRKAAYWAAGEFLNKGIKVENVPAIATFCRQQLKRDSLEPKEFKEQLDESLQRRAKLERIERDSKAIFNCACKDTRYWSCHKVSRRHRKIICSVCAFRFEDCEKIVEVGSVADTDFIERYNGYRYADRNAV